MPASPAASAANPTVSVGYAKSARSVCDGCSAAIDKGALRLGAHNSDLSITWYHVACFPASEHPLGPVEKVQGFDSIKEDEREELRALEKNNKRDRTQLGPSEEQSPKKARADLPSPEAGVAEKGTVSVEYESRVSTCEGCKVAIASVGVAAPHDRTKWYHVGCCPTSSHPLGPVEKLSIKDDDRVELEKNNERDQAAVGPLEVPSPNRAETEVEVAEKNDKRDQAAVGPLEAPSPKKAKACLSIPEVEVAEKDGDHEEWRELVKNNKRETALSPLEEPSLMKAKAHLSWPEAGVAEKGTVSVEYAKSACFTFKGCNLSINSLGILYDPRGYDKWYNAVCFPTSSHQLGPVEKLKGFDSIKDDDRMELQELEKNNKRDQAAVGPLEEPNRQKARLSLSEVEVAEKSSPANKGVGTVIPFSASHVKKTYKDATLPAQWKAFETVIFREQDDGLRASAKIAAFDFDGCLAKTSVKITGADKRSLQHKSIPDKLQSLYNDGYKLVIFTNGPNIERWKNTRQQAVDSKVGRLDNFIECVKVPIQVFIACGVGKGKGKGKGKGTPDDQFRKPNSGMWWLMAEHFNSGIAINMDQSFYVGDAAGRKKDHSGADIKFAKDVGLKFHVPEEIFGP